MTLNPRTVLISRYRIVELLGHDGFGAVYRVWDLNLETACTVRENLDTSPEAVRRQFEHGAKVMARMSRQTMVDDLAPA